MADNVGYTPGAGETIATDEIGGAHFQRVKLTQGIDGVATDVSATAPLPITAPSPLPIMDPALVLIGAAAQTAVVNNILGDPSGADATNVENFRAASVQVVSTGTGGSFIFEQSNDNVNWLPLPVFNSALTTGVPITAAIAATASAVIYTIPLRTRFLRLRIATTITGGSIRAFTRLSADTWTPSVPSPTTVVQPTGSQLNVQGSLTAGTAAIGDVGLQARANATGAATIHHIVSAAGTNVAQIKATAGRVMGWHLANTTASWRYVKLHNIASATAGAAVAITIAIPPNGTAQGSAPVGIAFATAISRSIVTGAADTDATAVAANDVVGDIFFA